MRVGLLQVSCSLLLGITNLNTACAAILNGSFEFGFLQPTETIVLNADRDSADDIPNWLVTSGTIDWVGTESWWPASDGLLWSIDLSGNGAGAISQTFTTVAGQAYEILFDMAGNPDDRGEAIKTMVVDAADQNATYTFDTTGKTFLDIGWIERSFFFTANADSTTLTFTSLNESFFGPTLDNVRLNEVPIPTAVWLFGSGLLGLIGVAKRKVRG